MNDLKGTRFDKVNRLAVVLVQEFENKLLAIPKTDGSTGEIEAKKIKEVLVDWGLENKIIACGFDTTSSNTGVYTQGMLHTSSTDSRAAVTVAGVQTSHTGASVESSL